MEKYEILLPKGDSYAKVDKKSGQPVTKRRKYVILSKCCF
jgi:hypothetical protein